MYLCQSIEHSVVSGRGQLQIHIWRAELDATGRPLWKLHAKGYLCRSIYADDRTMRRNVRKNTRKDLPFMQDAAHNKPVTMGQAERLTGLIRPAALDFLTEQLGAGENGALQNYVKPPKAKSETAAPEPVAEPTPVDRARDKLAAAGAKVAEWDAKVKHAQAKLKEWQRKARARERRVKELEAKAPAQATAKPESGA